MAIQIWLSDGSDRFRFPVNPESFEVSSNWGYEDVEIAQLGEVTLFGNRKMLEVNFDSFFPRDYNPSYCEYSSLLTPYYSATKILKWMQGKKVLQLTIIGSNVNIPVTIRSFNYNEKGGEVGDVYFSLSLKEYRKISPRIYDPNAKKTPSRPTSGTTTANRYYKVVRGDTMSKIAQKMYSDSNRWREIYNANKSKIGSNPNKIYVGMTLLIPGTSTSSSPSTSTSGKNPTFTIRSGDTFYEIANAYSNCSVNDLVKLNPNVKPSNLKVGTVIKLPVGSVKLRDPKRL